MGTDAIEEWGDQITDLMTDFASGLALLMALAWRNSAIVSREETLELYAAFESAYGPLAELQAVGQFETGGGILSPETGERVARLGALLHLPPEGTEAKDAAAEIRALAEECLRMLAPNVAPPSEPSEST
jgi:hypothetical protein